MSSIAITSTETNVSVTELKISSLDPMKQKLFSSPLWIRMRKTACLLLPPVPAQTQRTQCFLSVLDTFSFKGSIFLPLFVSLPANNWYEHEQRFSVKLSWQMSRRPKNNWFDFIEDLNSHFLPSDSYFSEALTSDILQIFGACLQRHKMDVNSKWQEWLRLVFFQVPSSYLYFLLNCKAKVGFNPWLSALLSVCCLKLADRAAVTGISNTCQPLNWLCQPLSITNMHAHSFVRRINLLSFDGVWWGFWQWPCPSFFYFHLFLPLLLYVAAGLQMTWFTDTDQVLEYEYLLVLEGPDNPAESNQSPPEPSVLLCPCIHYLTQQQILWSLVLNKL